MSESSGDVGKTRLVVYVDRRWRVAMDARSAATGRSLSAVANGILESFWAPRVPGDSYVKCDHDQWSTIVGRIQGMADKLLNGENPDMIAGRMAEFAETLIQYRREHTVEEIAEED